MSNNQLYVQWSHGDIPESYFLNGNYPSGNEKEWVWENRFIPVPHYVNEVLVSGHVYRRERSGNGNWSLPIKIVAKDGKDGTGTGSGGDFSIKDLEYTSSILSTDYFPIYRDKNYRVDYNTLKLDILSNILQDNDIISGNPVTITTNVVGSDVTATINATNNVIEYKIGGVTALYATESNISIGTLATTNLSRFVMFTLTAGGLSITQGAEVTNPVQPTPSSNELLIGYVLVTDSGTSISNELITINQKIADLENKVNNILPNNTGIVYISPNGSDINTGSTEQYPVQTLSRALTLAGNSKVIVDLGKNTYTYSGIIPINTEKYIYMPNCTLNFIGVPVIGATSDRISITAYSISSDTGNIINYNSLTDPVVVFDVTFNVRRFESAFLVYGTTNSATLGKIVFNGITEFTEPNTFDNINVYADNIMNDETSFGNYGKFIGIMDKSLYTDKIIYDDNKNISSLFPKSSFYHGNRYFINKDTSTNGSSPNATQLAEADGTSLYYKTPVFIPNNGQTLTCAGTTVTLSNPSSGFEFTANSVGMKIKIENQHRIITAFNSNNQVTIDFAFIDISSVTYLNWRMYSRCFSVNNDGTYTFYDNTGIPIVDSNPVVTVGTNGMYSTYQNAYAAGNKIISTISNITLTADQALGANVIILGNGYTVACGNYSFGSNLSSSYIQDVNFTVNATTSNKNVFNSTYGTGAETILKNCTVVDTSIAAHSYFQCKFDSCKLTMSNTDINLRLSILKDCTLLGGGASCILGSGLSGASVYVEGLIVLNGTFSSINNVLDFSRCYKYINTGSYSFGTGSTFQVLKPNYPLLQKSTTVKTIENTTTETDVISSSPIGDGIVPLYYSRTGTVISIGNKGLLSYNNGSQTLTLKSKWGATVLNNTVMTLPNSIEANNYIEYNIEIKVLTTGTTGSCIVTGNVIIYSSIGIFNYNLTSTTPVTINTTTNNTISSTIQWGTALAQNSFKSTNYNILINY